MKARAAKLWGIAALAGATALASVAALVALNFGGEARLGPVRLLAIGAGYDRRANALAASAEASPHDRAIAEELSQAAIGQFPYDIQAWLRLAYLDALQPGGLSPAGLAALQRSYDLVAVDPEMGVWRVHFALEHSQALTPALRRTVHQEADALWKNPQRRQALIQMVPTISNAAGRLSLALWLNRLSATVAK
jgi:hypothetical protein